MQKGGKKAPQKDKKINKNNKHSHKPTSKIVPITINNNSSTP